MQKRASGEWWFWEQTVPSDVVPARTNTAVGRERAIITAHEWQQRLQTEYGVHELEPEKGSERIKCKEWWLLGDDLTQRRAYAGRSENIPELQTRVVEAPKAAEVKKAVEERLNRSGQQPVVNIAILALVDLGILKG